MKRSILLASSLITLLSLSTAAIAAGPGSGSKKKYDIRIGRCNADTVKVKWKLSSMMGEATVAGSFKWTGDRGCRLPSSTTIWLKVTDGDGSKGYVRLAPVTPKANSGYGYNTTGSPNWNKALCGYRGTERTECLSKRSAKRLWKSGDVTDFKIQW